MDVPPTGTGHLRLTVQSTLLGKPAVSVRAEVDGEPVPVRHGENLIPLSAGRHRLAVSTLLVGGSRDVAAEVEVPRDGEVALWYAPPFHRGIGGRLGHLPQRAGGTWFVVLVVAIVVLGLAYPLLRGLVE
jgi:hypothetical protein